MTQLKVPVCALIAALCLACGPRPTFTIVDEDTTEIGSPVRLHELTTTPSCFVPHANVLAPTMLGQALLDMAAQQRDLLAMQASFEMQYARLMLTPVREEPTALEWFMKRGDAFIEGYTLARGTDWGRLALSMTTNPPPESQGRSQITMKVEYLRDATRLDLDFGAGIIEQGADYFYHGEFARGCSAQSHVSYEVGPWPVDGELREVALCWAHDAFPGIEPEPGQPGASMEMQVTSQCSKLLYQQLAGSLYDPVRREPVIRVLP